MTPMTKAAFENTYGTVSVSDTEFQRLADCAAQVVATLCFGRQDRDTAAAEHAMAVQIAAWLDAGGIKAVTGAKEIKHETVGNYSVSYDLPQSGLSLLGLPIAPEALMILSNAGLRDPAV